MNKIKSVFFVFVMLLQFTNVYGKENQKSQLSQMEVKAFEDINKKRMENSLPALIWSNEAAKEAQKHSINMANKKVSFGHKGFDARFKVLAKVIPGMTSFGENVAYNKGYADPVQIAVDGWMKSPGHYENIMGKYTHAAVGVAKNSKGEIYFTQLFVKISK